MFQQIERKIHCNYRSCSINRISGTMKAIRSIHSSRQVRSTRNANRIKLSILYREKVTLCTIYN